MRKQQQHEDSDTGQLDEAVKLIGFRRVVVLLLFLTG